MADSKEEAGEGKTDTPPVQSPAIIEEPPKPSPVINGGLLIAKNGKSRVAILIEKKGKGEKERIEARLQKFQVTTRDCQVAHEMLSTGAESLLYHSAKASREIVSFFRRSGPALAAFSEHGETRKLLEPPKGEEVAATTPAKHLPMETWEFNEPTVVADTVVAEQKQIEQPSEQPSEKK